LIASENFTY